MTVYISKEVQVYWNRLCEFYTQEERANIYSDLEFLIEQAALEKGVSLDIKDEEHKKLNTAIADRYIKATYGIAVYYLQKFSGAKEIPVIPFTYEELFKEEPADPPDQPG